jgi:hypothetical protein
VSARIPTVTITIPLEGALDVEVTRHTDDEHARLDAWLADRPEIRDLIERACKLRQTVHPCDDDRFRQLVAFAFDPDEQ